MVSWCVELSEFDIKYVTRGAIKAQELADFIVELVEADPESKPPTEFIWNLSVDGSSNLIGSGAGVTLEGPDSIVLEQGVFENLTRKLTQTFIKIKKNLKETIHKKQLMAHYKADNGLVIHQNLPCLREASNHYS